MYVCIVFMDQPLRELLSSVTLMKYEGIYVAVDFREGGGERHEFHQMCDMLQAALVPFFSRSLCVGDYLFFIGDKVPFVVLICYCYYRQYLCMYVLAVYMQYSSF
jgi:hypothetical protein